MKRFLTVLTFSLFCWSVALAGEIPSVGAPQPQSQQTTSPTLLGEIPSGGGSISDAAVSALLTVIGLASF